MYLNSAKVTSWVLNGKDYTGSRKRFMKALCETHNFTVNLVLGNKLLGRGNVSFMENSGWVMAHVDSRFAFDKDEHISGLTISICNNGNEILSSETEVSYFISGNMSTDADLYFIVGSVYAYNDSKEALPESFFRSSNYDRLTKISYEDLPSPVGPEPFDGLRIISDEFLVTKDGTSTETAYSILEIPSETVEYLSQSGELENFSVTFMGNHDDQSIWTGFFSANDYLMLYKTGDMPESGSYDGITLTTVHPSVYDGKEHTDTPIKVNIPGTVTIKTYINGTENSDSAYWPYTTFEDEYKVVVPAHKENDEPSEVVKIVSDTFDVTNDGGTTKKSAYSVVEIKKEDWAYLSENYPSASYSLMIMPQGSGWGATFMGMPGASNQSFMVMLSNETPSGADFPVCHLTTMSVKIYTKMAEEIPIPSGTVTVKTYIDNTENNDDSYAPANTSDYSVITAHIEGDEPVVVDWLWQSEVIGAQEQRPLYFKMSVTGVDSEYEDLIKGIESWQLAGAYYEAENMYILTPNKTIDGYTYSTSIEHTGTGYATNGSNVLIKTSGSGEPDALGTLKLQAFDSETHEMYDENTFKPFGSSPNFTVSMTKITE